jgi:SAM-dependent methyltransferase
MSSETEMPSTQQHFLKWTRGIKDELEFWDGYFATKGDQWPEDYKNRLDPKREIEPWLMDRFNDPPSAKILDVGAGPLTVLGVMYEGQKLDITACDPLAPFYAQLIEKHDVKRPVPTQTAFAEDLTSFFRANTFDLVHCRNALDHSFDPIMGIGQMLAVAKIGGRAILRHMTNEAERAAYDGLHQWNFNQEDGDFIVWNKAKRVNLQKNSRLALT